MAAILPTLPELRGLLEVTRLVRDERDLTRLVDGITEVVSSALGFNTVAINLFRPAEGDFEVVSVHGNEAARQALLGSTRHADAWTGLLTPRFCRRGAYLIPQDEGSWDDVPSYVPDLPVGDDPDSWHPEDALMAPMIGSDGALLGVIAVDEPISGLRPGDDELDLLVAFAQHVAAALEGAHSSASAARDRAALARLLDVSASLVKLDSVECVLATVANGIREALQFDKVAVCLHDSSGGVVPAGTAGWDPADPGLAFSFDTSELDILFVPEFEVEGCYLIGNETARALVANGSAYASVRNGGGPQAWRRHWLLVPLVERDGSRRGFVWVDDPVDCLLPSRERLQALRTFANHVTMALRAAVDFETLTARNRELATLHETTVGLLDGIDRDHVLERITRSACDLAGAKHAFLALVDEESTELHSAVKLGLLEQMGPKAARRGEGIAGRVWESGKTLVIDDYASWSGRIPDLEGQRFHATVGVPLLAAGKVVGVIGLAHDDASRSFGPAQVALLERFAGLAALALENASLYAALAHSEKLHRHVVDGSTDLIALVGLDGSIVLASRAYADVLGYDPEELVGTRLSDLVHPEDLEAARERVGDDPRMVEHVTARLRHTDGRWVVIEGVTTPIYDDRGALELLLVISRDITERQSLEEQLRHSQKMESIGRLAGGVAHDFNNILTAIRGYAELLLLDLADDAPARESAAEISRAASRAAELTGQLLAFSRKQVLRPQRLDLNEIVSEMSSMLRRLVGEDVVLKTELDTELSPTLADPTQVEQVLLNLAVNARDAMPSGGRLTIRTANVDGEDGPRVALVVADTGEGMDAATAERIFEPFFTTKEVGAGTGLGLATVHGIVAQSGGTIDVQSEPGVGTAFTICLPRVA